VGDIFGSVEPTAQPLLYRNKGYFSQLQALQLTLQSVAGIATD